MADEIMIRVKVRHGTLPKATSRDPELNTFYQEIEKLGLDGEDVTFDFPPDVPREQVVRYQSRISSSYNGKLRKRGKSMIETKLRPSGGGGFSLSVNWVSTRERKKE